MEVKRKYMNFAYVISQKFHNEGKCVTFFPFQMCQAFDSIWFPSMYPTIPMLLHWKKSERFWRMCPQKNVFFNVPTIAIANYLLIAMLKKIATFRTQIPTFSAVGYFEMMTQKHLWYREVMTRFAFVTLLHQCIHFCVILFGRFVFKLSQTIFSFQKAHYRTSSSWILLRFIQIIMSMRKFKQLKNVVTYVFVIFDYALHLHFIQRIIHAGSINNR